MLARLAHVTLLVVVLLLLGVLMVLYWPLGADYLYIYRPVTQHWIDGDTQLYDANALGFFNAPWTVILLVPIASVPVHTGEAILNISSIVSVVAAVHLFRQVRDVPAYVVFLAIANTYMLNLLIRGQIDGILLFSIALANHAVLSHRPLLLSLAFCFMAIKPLNVALPALLFLIAVRSWSWRDLVKVFCLPLVALATSPAIAGFDWPLRYLDFVQSHPVSAHRSISLWQIVSKLRLAAGPFILIALMAVTLFFYEAWKHGLTFWTLSLALVTNLTFTFYANGYHYLLLIPALMLIASHRRALVWAAYLLTWTPLLRVLDNTNTHWDYAYPVLLMLLLWAYAPHETSQVTEESSPVYTKGSTHPPVMPV